MAVRHSSPAYGAAPGKVILLGEHAVVYGRAALAGAIDRHVAVHLSARGPVRVATAPMLSLAYGRGSDGAHLAGWNPNRDRKGAMAGSAQDDVLQQALTRAAELIGVECAELVATITAD